MQRTERQGIYTRITNQIVSHLERGVRPWVRLWNTEHAAGRITRPPRHNGKPYSGINVLSLWASAMAQNFAAPIWMTFKQTLEPDAHIRKGAKGSLVVYADSITRNLSHATLSIDPMFAHRDDRFCLGSMSLQPLRHELLYIALTRGNIFAAFSLYELSKIKKQR